MTEDEIIRAVSRYFRIRSEHERDRDYGRMGHAWLMNQIAADVAHSALLRRLLQGKEPLAEPPPLHMSYPVYPDYPD